MKLLNTVKIIWLVSKSRKKIPDVIVVKVVVLSYSKDKEIVPINVKAIDRKLPIPTSNLFPPVI